MSDTGDITTQVQEMLASGTSEESSPPVGAESAPVETAPQPQSTEPLNEEFSAFLKNVADADKPTVQRYLAQVQANVTRQFQNIHKQYEPYKALGASAQEIAEQQQFLTYLRSPQGRFEAYQALQTHFAPMQQANPNASDPYAELQQQAIIPPQVQVQIQQQQAMLDNLLQRQQFEQQQQQERQEDAQVEQTFASLHTEFGAFDDTYVTSLMMQGMDPGAAVRQFQNMIQERINQANKAAAAPPILSGGQAASTPTPKLGNIPSKDIQSFVANYLNSNGS